MARQGFGGAFIDAFFGRDENILSADLDFVRAIALVTEEEFVLKEFYKKNFSPEEAKEFLAEYLSAKRYGQFPVIEDLLAEKKRREERFELQMDFLKREQEQARNYFEAILEKEREAAEAKKETERVKLEAEQARLMDKLAAVLEENARLQEMLEHMKAAAEQGRKQEEDARGQIEEAYRQTNEKCDELLCQLSGQQMRVLQKEKTGGILPGFFRGKEEKKARKEKQQRNRFIQQEIANPEYSAEQLDIILNAVKDGMPLEGLQQLCDPKLQVKNMKILMLFLKREESKTGETGKEVNKDGA